jgi:hypothetical protein
MAGTRVSCFNVRYHHRFVFHLFLVLDKLNENGGAENIHFDWWNADNNDDDDKKVDETEEQAADKNKVNTILLNLCYKVSLIFKQCHHLFL